MKFVGLFPWLAVPLHTMAVCIGRLSLTAKILDDSGVIKVRTTTYHGQSYQTVK